MQASFAKIANDLETNEEIIVKELNDAQGEPVNIGGYYLPCEDLISKAMRPSATFNAIIDSI